MCRLFGLHAGPMPVHATFWLVDAPDSLAAQSHRNPDGVGIGIFGPDGAPSVDKQPVAAWQDREFMTAARELRSTTFLAHVLRQHRQPVSAEHPPLRARRTAVRPQRRPG